ncbi:DUF3389 domain-containing protein [Vibrio sp. SS-MA-C1-2]|uniref:DUF3389 family protein n=1 Tax=Vibrio sp. SS-MA-C1-2 TaxID=2908646 RepID=UPI001F2CBB99|nr:DUF3389 family protein [Vibrio sp. SS-MA-C1-2]UJF17433.1 DUF3389 domain-containing protein [Vibrio sp. SS-MA-C1-2]
MVITFSFGKLIMTPYELVIKLPVGRVTLQAQPDDLTLLSDENSGVNIISADTGSVKWNMTLDNAEQLQQVSDMLGVALTKI